MAAKQILVGNYFQDNYTFQQPYWIMVTLPYKLMDTVDRAKILSEGNDGFRIVTSDDAKDDDSSTLRPIIWDNEIISWSINQEKSQHVSMLSFDMVNVDNNVASFIWLTPGDWCMFWAFNDRNSYETIHGRLRANYGAKPWTYPDREREQLDNDDDVNFYSSGLKFVGRVWSTAHFEHRMPDGKFQLGYRVQARMFSELDNLLYYNDLIAFKYKNALQFMPDFGVSIRQFLSNAAAKNAGFVNTNVFIPAFIKIAMGDGPGAISKDKGDTQIKRGSSPGLQASPNVAYQVPKPIMKMVGRDDRAGTNKHYADMLLQIIGVQSYDHGRDSPAWQSLLPDGETVFDGSVHFCTKPLVDYFPPDPMLFHNKTIWASVQAYLNPPINEAFTCLRPHPDTGRLTPAVVVRRAPYSSLGYARASGDDKLDATAFADLPRWVIPTGLVKSFDVQRSDDQRFNYIHVTPSVMPAKNTLTSDQLAIIEAPPVVDSVSIKRYGLKLYSIRVAGFANIASESSKKNTAARYTNFMADILLDGHLRLHGTMTTVGIQDPIQPGDNLQINGLVFQIEGLSHSGSIAADGVRRFETTLRLSYGAPAKVIDGNASSREVTMKKLDDKFIEATQGKITEQELIASLEEAQEDIDSTGEPPSDDELRQMRNERRDLDGMKLIGAGKISVELQDDGEKS